MLCNSVMRPVLLLAGGLVLALSAGYGLLTFRQRGDA
jgi:hypothetical protein